MNYIAQKQSLLIEILENTRSQTCAIENDDLEILDTLITERDVLMEQVDKLDKESSAIISTTPSEQVESLKELLKDIIQIDDANQLLMQKEFEHVKTQLRRIRLGRQQEQSYGNEYGFHKEEGVFFDTKEYEG